MRVPDFYKFLLTNFGPETKKASGESPEAFSIKTLLNYFFFDSLATLILAESKIILIVSSSRTRYSKFD